MACFFPVMFECLRKFLTFLACAAVWWLGWPPVAEYPFESSVAIVVLLWCCVFVMVLHEDITAKLLQR